MYLIRKLLLKAKQVSTAFIFFFSILFITFSSITIHIIEPETFPTVFEGLWWTMTTVTTVGYGDVSPATVPGKVFGMVVFVFGIGMIGLVIGKIVDLFGTYNRLREEGKLKFRGKDQIVIFGWSEAKAKNAIEEILLCSDKKEVVIIDQLEKHPYNHERVTYIQGDPTRYETFDQANLLMADAVLIFAPEDISSPMLADGQTLLIASALESYSAKHHKNIYTIVEILKNHHKEIFKHAKVEEFILSGETASHMMAKSSIARGSMGIFSQLLSREVGDDLWEIPRKSTWTTYRDAYHELLDLGANLIADGSDLGIMRKLDQPIPDQAQLFVISDEETYTKVINHLQSS